MLPSSQDLDLEALMRHDKVVLEFGSEFAASADDPSGRERLPTR
jgi:hypothetical protein